MAIRVKQGNLKGEDHYEDSGINGDIIL